MCMLDIEAVLPRPAANVTRHKRMGFSVNATKQMKAADEREKTGIKVLQLPLTFTEK